MNNIPIDYRTQKAMTEKKDRPPKLKYQLAMVTFTMLVLMTAYEWLKQSVSPNISIWGSHLITIFFTSFLATIASFFIFKKLNVAYQKLFNENTERKMAEKALKQSRDTLNTILSASPIAICLAENRTLRWMNEEMASIFRLSSKEEYKEKNIRHLYINEDEYHRSEKKIYDELKIGKPYTDDVTFKRKDGSTFIGHLKISCQDPSNPVKRAVFTISDITWRKKADEEREKLITELQTALAEIKTLRGILPLCSHCKKIRNDEGYWEQVDVYIHKYSEADISHSICPECMKKYYPEEYETFIQQKS